MSPIMGEYAQAAQQVLFDDAERIPQNTKIAYGRKGAEFIQFCDTIYQGHPYARTVTPEKTFGFLFYQAYRSKRRRGRAVKNRMRRNDRTSETFENDNEDDNNDCADFGSNTSGHAAGDMIFDVNDYKDVMAKYNCPTQNIGIGAPYYQQLLNNGECADLPDPVGYDVVNQYLCAILKILQHQCANQSNTLTPKHIRGDILTRLMNHVKRRHKSIKKARHEEKVGHELSPYVNVQNLERLEEFLFQRNSSMSTFFMSSLRDRFCLLMTHCGVLRGESLFKCELSDLCDIIITDEGPHPCQILIMQIAVGKTNGLKTLYGRVMRHKNVNMCPIGALGFYLMARFHLTNEMETYDFNRNSSWFDVKLLVNYKRQLNTSMSDQAYAKAMRDACNKLSIMSSHFVHFGRGTGAVMLEFQEVDPQYIKMLGNWNPDVQEDRYSSKLPLKAMRAMAGHPQQKGCFYLPRSCVNPPEALQKQIFPFIEQVKCQLEESPEGVKRATASAFICLLDHLRNVILQDAAVMIQNGREHYLLSLPVFKTDLFKDFQSTLNQQISREVDPVDASLEQVLPGVCSRIDNLHHDVLTIHGSMDKVDKKVDNIGNLVQMSNAHMEHFLNHVDAYRRLPPRNEQFHQDVTQGHAPPQVMAAGADGPARKKLYCEHTSATSMWNEWFGLDRFHSDGCIGGIAALEKDVAKTWRHNFNAAEQKHFSRLKFIINQIQAEVEADVMASGGNDENGQALQAVLSKHDNVFKQRKFKLSTFCEYLKKQPRQRATEAAI